MLVFNRIIALFALFITSVYAAADAPSDVYGPSLPRTLTAGLKLHL